MEENPQGHAQEKPAVRTNVARRAKSESAFDFVTLQTARRLESCEAQSAIAYVAALRRFRVGTRAAFLRIGSGVAVFTGIDSPITQAVGIGLDGPVSEKQIEKLERFYDEREDSVRVELCPLADKSVTDHFGKRGYRVVDYSNVLLRRLGAKVAHGKSSKEVSVEQIGRAQADLWGEVVARGFAEQMAVTAELLEVLKMFVYAPGSECYLARVGGAAAGGAALGFRKGIASLSGASTLPEFRNRGVQTALLQARVARAKAAGCDLAMSIAQPGSASHRNIERLGFRVVYTRVKFQRDKKDSTTYVDGHRSS